MGGARLATVVGVLAVLLLLLWPSSEPEKAQPVVAEVLASGASEEPEDDEQLPGGTGTISQLEEAAPEATSSQTTPRRGQRMGSARCVDPSADPFSAAGLADATFPAWVDVQSVDVVVSPAMTVVSWELARAIPDQPYAADDVFASATWTTVLRGEVTSLHLVARLDGDIWNGSATDVTGNRDGLAGRVDIDGRMLRLTFETDVLGPLDDELQWFAKAEVGPPGQQIDPIYDRLTDVVCGEAAPGVLLLS